MAKKLLILALCSLAMGCASQKQTSISQIRWPMPQAWVDRFGDGPDSQRDYNIWLLGQNMKQTRTVLKGIQSAVQKPKKAPPVPKADSDKDK